MKRLFVAFSLVAMAMVGVVATPDEGSAVPGFARQTGNPCMACHFQYFPKLNAYGRAFKMGGFRETSHDLIEDDNMSLLSEINFSFVFKYRVTSTTPQDGDATTKWDMPDEAVFLGGGRVSEKIGALVEFADGGAAEFKMVYVIVDGDVRFGVIPWWGSGVGVGSNDPLSTGFNKTGRPYENRDNWSAYGHTENETGGYGVNLFANSELFHVAVGMWAPDDQNTAGFDLATQARLTFMPTVGDMELGIGIGYVGGTSTVDDADTDFEMLSVDGQLQTEFGDGMTLQVNAAYVTGGGDDIEVPSVERNNMSFDAAVGINPQIVVGAGYAIRGETSGGTDYEMTSTNLMAKYLPAQNLSITLEYMMADGDAEVSRIGGQESKWQIQVFTGF